MFEFRDDGTVGIYTAFTEMWQGLFTVLQQTACEETGLPPGVFSFVSADTKYPVDCGQTTGSRGTFLGCRFFFSSRRRHTRFDCDWSSDACSSDLWPPTFATSGVAQVPRNFLVVMPASPPGIGASHTFLPDFLSSASRNCRSPGPHHWMHRSPCRKIGRASCRERVEIAVVAGSVKK